MKSSKVSWNENGWTVVQEASAEKHIIEISCRCENGIIVEVHIRHNDGEERKGVALLNGENALPLSIDDFKKLFKKGALEIR